MHQSKGSPPRYVASVRFRTPGRAKTVYARLQALLHRAETSELSAYNLELNGQPFVAVLGDPPATELHERVRAILQGGTATPLPESVIAALQRRREEERRLAPWVEHHHHPGIVLPVDDEE